MLRRCPKCRKDGGLVYCPVCHGVKRDDEQLAKAIHLLRDFADYDLPGNPSDTLLKLFIAAEDFIREYEESKG